MSDEVQLVMPADPEFLRLARVTASGIANAPSSWCNDADKQVLTAWGAFSVVDVLIAIVAGYLSEGIGFPSVFLAFVPCFVVGLQLLSATAGGRTVDPGAVHGAARTLPALHQ